MSTPIVVLKHCKHMLAWNMRGQKTGARTLAFGNFHFPVLFFSRRLYEIDPSLTLFYEIPWHRLSPLNIHQTYALYCMWSVIQKVW